MVPDSSNLLLAFILTILAGLSTGIGSALAFFTKTTNKTFLAISLGFSAGVMIYISFSEILNKAYHSIKEIHNDPLASWYTVGAFFAGILLILIIDRLIPKFENPHELKAIEDLYVKPDDLKLYKSGLITALAIAIHNFPEGLATFSAAVVDPKIGIPTAIAVAIHNIPEGIAISIPIFYATNSRVKAFWYSFLSGLAEPFGALIGYFILFSLVNAVTFGILFAAVAGIMVFVSFDELLPTAREYDKGHKTIYGLLSGMLVMAVSLILMM